LIGDFLELWATGVVLAVKQAGGVIANISRRAAKARAQVDQTGPIEERLKADGTPNEALLYNTLGGETYV
jgi:hypothetical protein